MTDHKRCIFCGYEWLEGELIIKHMVKKHYEKIPIKIHEDLDKWYIQEESALDKK
jgi:hypothetical protein